MTKHFKALVVMGATFLATLVLPIQEAILVGIVLSILDFVYTSSRDVEVVELTLADDGSWVTNPPLAQLEDNRVTVLYSWGSIFFAGARAMEAMLPDAKDAQRAVVILRLHGRMQIRSTFIIVLERYAQKLQANGGKLILSGVSENPSRLRETLPISTASRCRATSLTVQFAQTVGRCHSSGERSDNSWLSASRVGANRSAIRIGSGGRMVIRFGSVCWLWQRKPSP